MITMPFFIISEVYFYSIQHTVFVPYAVLTLTSN